MILALLGVVLLVVGVVIAAGEAAVRREQARVTRNLRR